MILSSLAPTIGRGEIPRTIGYQGRLLRADGTAATGTATVGFAMCAAETGGTPLWQESQTLGLSDGYYSTFPGLVAPPSDGVFEAERRIEVRVGSETLSPRCLRGQRQHGQVVLDGLQRVGELHERQRDGVVEHGHGKLVHGRLRDSAAQLRRQRLGSHIVYGGSTSDSGCSSGGGCHAQVWIR